MASAAVLGSAVKNSKRVCLFYCHEMKDLAERIASQSDAIELRSITWRYGFRPTSFFFINFIFILEVGAPSSQIFDIVILYNLTNF